MGWLDRLGLGNNREKRGSGAAGDTETVRAITPLLEDLGPERARFLAAFAYLLSRVARADLSVSAEETEAMERIVREEGGLPDSQASLVVSMARSRSELFGATEDFLVAREFSEVASRDEKMALLRCLFAVSASDDSISVSEDNEVRRISRELRLEHADFIAARSAWREQLAVLKNPSRGRDRK